MGLKSIFGDALWAVVALSALSALGVAILFLYAVIRIATK